MIRFREDIREISDSAQTNTNISISRDARGPFVDFSKYFWQFFENKKLTNTARSQTQREVRKINFSKLLK